MSHISRYLLLGLVANAAFAAAPPHVFYTDLLSGPNSGGQNNQGAIVTIYGARFGNTQRGAYVTVGGGRAAAYPCWSDTKVCIQLGPAAQSGDLILTTSDGASNASRFEVRTGRIFFVAVNGKDHNSGSFSSPWRTLTKARDSMKAGDITYAMDGTSQTTDDGMGWNTCFLISTGGVAGRPMALVAYPGATVTIGSPTNGIAGLRANDKSPGYWVFAGLKLRGQNEAILSYGPNQDWRFVGNDLWCPNGDGASACYETTIASHVQFLGNNVHDTGRPTASALYHGVYFSTDSNFIEVGWNKIYNVHGCRGIQINSTPIHGGPTDPSGQSQYGISIHDNIIHDTQCDAIVLSTVDPSKGKIEIYNNIIYNAGKGPANPENSGNWSCVYVAGYTNTGNPGGGTVQVYHNTMFNCGTFATPPYDASRAAVMNGGHNPKLQIALNNNLVYEPGTIPYVVPPNGVPGLQGQNNLFYGSGSAPGGNFSKSVNRDPLLVSPFSGDFHLQSASPARGKGALDSATYDFDGIPRNAAAGIDLGALQYVSTDSTQSMTGTKN